MKKEIETYNKDLSINTEDIKNIYKKLNIDNKEIENIYTSILESSTKNIVNKWVSGRKYARTFFVRQVFNKFYPEHFINLSITIDGIINILDDLLDEEMDKDSKGLYIIELLRLLALYNLKEPPSKIQISFGHYFNKLISLAVAEDHYKKLIQKETNKNKIISNSLEIFNCRSMDIDIFNEIALNDYQLDTNTDKIKEIARIFRALNIIKKDIDDIEYDIKNNTETVIAIMFKNNDYKFPEYISDLLAAYRNKSKEILNMSQESSSQIKIPINNYSRMINDTINQITKLSQK